MRTANLTIIAIALLTSFVALAHEPQEGDIWASVGPYVYRTKSSAAEAKNMATDGGGIVAEGDVDYNGGVEIAMIYLDKLYIRDRGAERVVEKIKRMYVTSGYRHWLYPSFSGALAFYSAYSMGDVDVVLDRRSSSEELFTTARDITEYGFDISLQWQIYGDKQFGVVADARYSLSMTRKQQEDADVYGVMLTFKYLVPKHG